MTQTTLPDPVTEIRITTLHATRGINFWSRRPVIRMDLAVGDYEDISSAEAPKFTDCLVSALPGLKDHHCSLGARGGFVTRLRRGTYAPHIIEHVALELQAMIGLEVGYGRTRGGDVPGEYTVVFEHRHEQVVAAGLEDPEDDGEHPDRRQNRPDSVERPLRVRRQRVGELPAQ